MKLPNAEKATIDPANWSALVDALSALAVSGEAKLVHEGEFGRKYLVSGNLLGPGGRVRAVTSVWILDPESDTPRLVTVYPG